MINKAVSILSQAKALIISAGAGMSVDSGLPDYRGPDGFWNNFPMYRELAVDYEKATRPSGFLRDAEFTWGFYGHCFDLYSKAIPHQGYSALLALANQMPLGYFIFTSNIDGQFQKAGFNSDRIHECHGSIHRLQCLHPCSREVWPVGDIKVQVNKATMRAIPPLPRCPRCGSVARPNVFAFGDTSFIHEPYTTQAAAFISWREGLSDAPVAIIECGAGSTVPGIRRHGESLCAGLSSAHLIRINLRESECRLTDAVSLKMTAKEALTTICDLVSR